MKLPKKAPRAEQKINLMLESLWGVLSIGLGWIGFGLFHSLFSRTWVKRGAERLWGPAFLGGLYRPLYALLSTGYLLWLWIYSYGLDGDWTFFSLPTWMSFFPFAGKAASVGLIIVCFREINFSEFIGAGQFLRWWRGELDGRSYASSEEDPTVHLWEPLACRGVYLWVRHPLNTAAFVWIWPQQDYTLYNITFAACLTLYILIANQLEENDLFTRYGVAYERYRQIVPDYFSGFRGISQRAEILRSFTLQN
jgi:hypothetical protein